MAPPIIAEAYKCKKWLFFVTAHKKIPRQINVEIKIRAILLLIFPEANRPKLIPSFQAIFKLKNPGTATIESLFGKSIIWMM